MRLKVRGRRRTRSGAEPGQGQARITGAFHAWRIPGRATALKLPPIDQALGAGLLTDPELDLYHMKFC